MGASWGDEAHRVWATLPAATPAGRALARFLADWPVDDRSAAHVQPLSPEPAGPPLPVLRWLPWIAGEADGFGADFVKHLCAEAASLDWRQTYTVNETEEPFLQNYGWAELSRPAPAAGVAQISCGVLVLGTNTFYPRHRHEAEEIYLPLAGNAEWQQGDGAWRRRSPGTLIHHSSEEPHAMRTGDEPLLAMYLWRSRNLDQRARLDRMRSAG
jgi:quercetin dioxygenase-like cupin family protein